MFTRDSVYPPSEYAIASPFYGGTPGHQPRGRVVHRSMIRSIMSGTTLRPRELLYLSIWCCDTEVPQFPIWRLSQRLAK
jgi:hypothetical protein